jgi:Fe-S cluster assembly protein SufD
MATEDHLRDLMKTRASGAVPWLAALREAALGTFRGLPTRRIEAWKYSDLARAMEDEPAGASVPGAPLVLAGADQVLFEDGVLGARPDKVQPLRTVLADPMTPYAGMIGQINAQTDHALMQLNTALMEDGLIVHVPRGDQCETPLQIRFSWTGRETDGRHLRLLFVLEEGAQLSLLETHDGAPSFASIVTEVKLGTGASLTHTRLERLGAGARQAAVTLGELGANATYRGFYLSEGGAFARHEALIRLAGEGAEARLGGAYLVAESRHCDNTTVLTHAAPKTLSRQAFRGVLSGAGRGVYQGAVSVRPDAQGTDARQLSRTILLSHKAEIATKPELEILADDVQCSHGATAGELDHNALFFLRARGIPEAEARALLVGAFLEEALLEIGEDGQRGLAAAAVANWLDRHAGEVSHVD